jgi:uncharacterized membrane protein
MTNPTKRQFLEFALDRMKQEHADLQDTWKQLDSKAQATASIAGVFLAAAFAFVRNSAISLGISERVLLSGGVLLLVAAITFAVVSMRLRASCTPTTGAETLDLVEQILECPADEGAERYVRMLMQILRTWGLANEDMRSGVACKSRHLGRAQFALGLSACFILLLTIGAIAFPTTPTKEMDHAKTNEVRQQALRLRSGSGKQLVLTALAIQSREGGPCRKARWRLADGRSSWQHRLPRKPGGKSAQR